ncbi:toxin-antitoxin system YwqK family antitoxin [Allomuricauda sp. R78024]|uniref:toxin-antitoxin system YwqK family antitoxin n=1 Tax=Allomuricauda sp. R78024 TaxID=3093867 RepID=UPI0037CBD987
MKIIPGILLLLFVSCILSCEHSSEPKKNGASEEKIIANVQVAKDSLVLNGNEGNWYYKNQLFTGYAVKYHMNDSLQQKVGFYEGKKMGIAKVWFPNGILKIESHYNQNKLVGSYKAWWNNGVLASKANYVDGKIQGIEKKWYKTGELAKSRNLVDGKEIGLQQAWLKNGKLYVNYEAKNGRIFGMRRANSCYKLKDEEVVLSKN